MKLIKNQFQTLFYLFRERTKLHSELALTNKLLSEKDEAILQLLQDLFHLKYGVLLKDKP